MEDVLERHRSKLQEHRQFLQSYKAASANGKVGDQSPQPAAPAAVSTPDTTLLTVDGTQLMDHSMDGAPSPAARAPPSHTDEASRPATTAAPMVTEVRRPASTNKAPEDAESLLRSRGRYTSSQPPDAMYVKSQAWLRRREWQTEAARRAQAEEEREVCTFAPRLSHAEAAHTYTNSEDEQWIDTAAEVRRARHGADERQTTSPSQTASAARASEQRQPTVGILSDPSVVKHMTRLEAARQRKEDDERRVRGVDIDKWRNETTKPRPFQLGQRTAEPIPSLRKPYVGGLDKAHFDPSAFMNTEELSVVDLLKEQVRQRDLVIGDQECEILHLQQELREVRAMLVHLTAKDKSASAAKRGGEEEAAE